MAIYSEDVNFFYFNEYTSVILKFLSFQLEDIFYQGSGETSDRKAAPMNDDHLGYTCWLKFYLVVIFLH